MRKLVSKKGNKRKRKARLWFKRVRFLFIVASIIFIIISIRNYFNDKASVTENSLQQNHAQSKAVIRHDTSRTEPLKNDLDEYLKSVKGYYGIYYYNLSTGDELGINEEAEFTAASTIKVPLNLMLYEKIANGEINPNATLKYLKEDYEGGTGSIQYEQAGKIYSLKELSRLSIVQSDNVATNMLLRFFGLYNLKAYMRQSGAKVVDNTRNISCPRDMGLYMERIYDLCKSHSAQSIPLLESLQNTDFNDRIPALLPKNIQVAHKIGTQVGVVNDVGIVFTDKPYIISIMSREVVESDAVKILAEISKKVYDFNNSMQ